MKTLRTLLAAVVIGLILHGLAPLPRIALQPRLFEGTLLEATYTPTPIKSIQQITGTSAATVTITSVNVGSTLLVAQGMSTTNAGGFPDGSASFAYAQLTNATTVTLTAGTAQPTWAGVVVEFLPQFAKSQHCGTVAIADASLTATDTITSVSTTKTIVASTGWKSAANGSEAMGAQEGRVVLTNATTITATKGAVANGSSGSPAFVAGYCYVEFK